ncbi:hypothetical protein D6789_02485 [Candidatus Woesearchaeota archaeon]|nr:MAG: hypothetical protein D6789_02485 [Candidatus Woesearchaeota archaeon]
MVTWRTYGPVLILSGFTVLAVLLILVGSAPAPTGNVAAPLPSKVSGRIPGGSSPSATPRTLEQRAYGIDAYTCADLALLRCGLDNYQRALDGYISALKLQPYTYCGGQDCAACTAKLWNELSKRVPLPRQMSQALEHCFVANNAG